MPRVLLTLVLTGLLLLPTTGASAAPERRILHREWSSGADFERGRLAGVEVHKGAIRIDQPTGTRRYHGRTYDVGRWRSRWQAPGFGVTELIASWSARTPGDSWIAVQVRGRSAQGRKSSWDTLGRWTSGDKYLRRTSVPGQGDDLATVAVDTWRTHQPAGVGRWQLRVVLLRGQDAKSPKVDAIGAMASRLPDVENVATSRPGVAGGVTLDVPRYSQMIHRGHYPRWGSGGQAWCSPTSTSMVLGYYDALPAKAAYSWVEDGHRQPWVDHAARMTYDDAYQGTGNWPFNTAYAADRTGHAFVTRLRSLREAEQFIAAGIPLVASISFGAGELDGAPISSTNGHLLVIVGFTDDGDVVVNDPAAARKPGVRRTYDRGQFEDAWLPTSGGLVYVIRDQAHPLPDGRHSNW